jgi:uncharacterized protein (DUF1015 family)
MAEIAPLTPLRYALGKHPSELANLVAPPYDVIGAEQHAELMARDPHNVVRLILPEGDGDARYVNAGALLQSWLASGVLARDAEPAFYRYDQTFLPPAGGGKTITRRGFLALVRLVPLSAGVVLPHERTLTGPKEDRLKLFRATRTNLSPGFMLYRDPNGVIDGPLQNAQPVAEFSTHDGIHHALAKVTAPDALAAITDGVAKSTLLIADGHHRYETALRYSEEAALANPGAHARGEHLYFMTFLTNGDDPELVVFPTHRLAHSLPSFSYDALLTDAAAWFNVRPLATDVDAATASAALAVAGKEAPSFVAVAGDGRAAVLSLRADVDVARHPTLGDRPAVLQRTDVAVLHSAILEHLLGITKEAQAAKTNLFYPQDAAAAMRDVRGGKAQVLFLMNATPVKDVRRVAEAGEVMPQKSTFFHPKVLTGLAIHTLDPARPVASAASADASHST